MLVIGLTAIVGLIDDYLTYMEGDESKFDWGPWEKTIEGVRAAIGDAIKAVVTFVSENGELIAGIAKAAAVFVVFGKVGKFLAPLAKGLATVATGGNLVARVAGLAGVAFKGLFAILRANPLGVIVTAAMLIYEYWEPISGFFKNLWAKITAAFPDFSTLVSAASSVLSSFCNYFLALFAGNFDEAGRYVWAMLSGLGNMVLSALSGLVSVIGAIFSSLWGGVEATFPDFAEWASDAAQSITGLFGEAINWVKKKLAALIDFLPDWVKEKMGINVQAAVEEPEPPKPPAAQDRRREAKPVAPVPAPQPVAPPPPVAVAASNAHQSAQAMNAPASASFAGSAGGRGERVRDQHIKIDSNTNITVNGTDSPQQVGGAVAGAQDRVNADIVRNTKGAVR